MVEVNPIVIILTSFFGGVGTGIALPITAHVYDIYFRKKVERLLKTPLNVTEKAKNEINEILGRNNGRE